MKLLKLFTILTASLCLVSCNENVPKDFEKLPQNDTTLVVLCKHSLAPGENICTDVYFIYDTSTSLVYTWADGHYSGSFQPYYNKAGEIMTYAEFQKVHKH